MHACTQAVGGLKADMEVVNRMQDAARSKLGVVSDQVVDLAVKIEDCAQLEEKLESLEVGGHACMQARTHACT